MSQAGVKSDSECATEHTWIFKVEMLGYGLERGEKLDFEMTEEAVFIRFPLLSRFIEECGQHCLPAFVLRMHKASPKIPKVQFNRVIT